MSDLVPLPDQVLEHHPKGHRVPHPLADDAVQDLHRSERNGAVAGRPSRGPCSPRSPHEHPRQSGTRRQARSGTAPRAAGGVHRAGGRPRGHRAARRAELRRRQPGRAAAVDGPVGDGRAQAARIPCRRRSRRRRPGGDVPTAAAACDRKSRVPCFAVASGARPCPPTRWPRRRRWRSSRATGSTPSSRCGPPRSPTRPASPCTLAAAGLRGRRCWPMLADADGRWIGAANAPRFCAFAERLARELGVGEVVLDLEPWDRSRSATPLASRAVTAHLLPVTLDGPASSAPPPCADRRGWPRASTPAAPSSPPRWRSRCSSIGPLEMV